MAPGILLIHADKAVIARFQQALAGQGYQLTVATDGLQGLARVDEVSPDLVVADFLLPRLDGVTLLRALRARPDTRSTPFFFLSGNADPALMMHALAMGARFFITVPFHADDLCFKIHRVLESPGQP